MAIKNDARKLQEALEIIKSECEFHGSSCSMCPFSIDDWTCGIIGARPNLNENWKKKPRRWNLPQIRLIAKEADNG